MNSFLNFIANYVFVVQLFVAVLVFMWRIPKRDLFVVRFIVCILVCCAASSYWDFSLMATWWGVLVIAAQYLILIGLALISIWVCWKFSWSQAAFYCFCSYGAQHLAYIFTEIVFSILYRYVADFVYDNYYLIKYLNDIVGMAVVYSIMCCFVVRVLNRNFDRLKFNGLVVPGILLIIGTVVLNLYRQAYIAIDVVTECYSAISCILALAVFVELSRYNKLSNENEHVEEMLNLQSKYAEMSKENIELVNLKCHDLKHRIEQFSVLDDSEEKQRYIDELQKDVLIYENVAKTGYEALDTILTERNFLCESEGIHLTCIVDEHSLDDMPVGDLYSLFCNALDNAIESVRNLPPEKKIISFNVTKNAGITNLDFENYYEGEIRLNAEGMPVTSKKDDRYHGFGLRSIRYIAKKYGGEISIKTSEDIFSLSVVMMNDMFKKITEQ